MPTRAFTPASTSVFTAFNRWRGCAVDGSVRFHTSSSTVGTENVTETDANGQQVFLLTPNKAPFPSKAPDKAQAPLYLVAYPTNSTLTGPFNCTPTTCDHVQSVPLPWYPSNGLLKGHDHLVGIANTGGDFNVAWDVELDAFTQKGFGDGAINHRIMTLDELNAAKSNGDIQAIDTGIVFNCSSTNIATYLKGTPLTFTP